MKKPKGFGSAPKKMAKGGNASQSKGGATKGSAPNKKGGGNAAGKTANTSSVKGGGGIGNAVRGAFSGGAGKSATVTDPKTGKSFARPTYGAMSLKGLTSTDPANVARNRAAAQMYAQKAAEDAKRNPNRGDGKSLDRGPPAPNAPTETPVVAPKPTRVYMPPPAGYRPGIDPEWKYYQPQAPASATPTGPIGRFGAMPGKAPTPSGMTLPADSALAARLRAMGPMLAMKKGGKVTAKPKPKGEKK